ncbi:hypothetical protein F2Q69_00015063 [Brassica cretica]|uniref:Uncharacterized protein n=1 Tax=Brassica cretica TaxID=69181 RepID=A0A8S9QSU9_BRACR|nr:hypothetical protein F2Q69_00015063 [Brassica cretica]
MIQLARIFHHRGFSFSILHTFCNFPDPSQHPHLTFRTIYYNNEGYAEPFRESLSAEVSGGYKVCCLVSGVMRMWGRQAENAADAGYVAPKTQ